MFFQFWSQVAETTSTQPAESLRDKMIRETESALTVKLAADRRELGRHLGVDGDA